MAFQCLQWFKKKSSGHLELIASRGNEVRDGDTRGVSACSVLSSAPILQYFHAPATQDNGDSHYWQLDRAGCLFVNQTYGHFVYLYSF